MKRFYRQISTIILFLLFSVSNIYADSCASPTDNIILNSTLKDQEIDKPFVVGLSGGEALYYEIELSVDGRLIINTATDTYSGANALDTVNTYGRLLNPDCSNLDTNDIEISTDPRYFKFDKVLTAGTYYLRVHNEVTLDDSGSDLAKGFFQIENSFTATAPTKQISITKTSATTIDSGEEIIYTINVKNEGTDATTSVQISDPLPTPNHLTYIGVDTSTPGWSCVAGDPVVCTLDSGIINYNTTEMLKLKYRADYQTYDRVVSNTTFVDVDYADASTLHEDAALRSVPILKETPAIDLTMNTYKTGTWTGITTVIEGESFDYRIAVRNSGTLVDENVTITDTIPAEFQITGLDYDNTIMTCSSSGQDVTCDLLADLAVGVTRDMRVKVKAIGAPVTNISNTSFTTGDTILGAVNDTDTKSMDILAKNALINITKTRSTANVIVGHSAYYTISVKNNGNIPLTNVLVTDVVPSQLKLTSASRAGWDCSETDTEDNEVECELTGSLDPGVTHYFYVYVEGKTVANNVINTAYVTTTEAATDNDDETLNVIAQTAGIRIQKSVSPTTVNSLDTFTYTLAVDNNGSESNSDIVVTDTIDAGLTLPADWNSNAAPWSCSNSGNDITCDYTGTLASGASATNITLKVQAPYTTTNLTIANTAIVNAKAGITLTPVSDTDSVSVNIVPPSIGFFLTKTSDKNSVMSGESYVYTIRVDNNGTLGEQDIVVKDSLPSLLDGNFTLNAGNFDCSATVGRDINCKLATLAAGAHDQFMISITAPVVTSSTVVVNDVKAEARIFIPPHVDETKTGSDSATVTINPASSSLSIAKGSSQDLILENDTFDYLISVKNNSIADEHNLTVTDDIHSDLTILSHSGSGWSCSQSGTLVTCTMASLGAGVQADDINITVQAPNMIPVDKTITNSAKVVSSKEVIGKTAQKDVTLVAPGNSLRIHMTSNPGTVYANDLYYYKIFITNNSGKDIDGIQLSETLPAELQYDHYVSGGWNCDFNSTSRVFSCDNNGTKLGGGEKVIELYVIAPNYETNVTNSLSLTTSLDPYVRDANATTEVIGKTAKLIYTKALSNKNIVSIGEDFTYTLKVKNDGVAPDSDINATNVKIAFDLDQNVSYQSHAATGWNCTFSAPTLTCDLPVLEAGHESPDINVTVQGLMAKQAVSIANLTADQVPLPQAVAISISVDVREVVDLDMSLELSDSVDPAEADSIYYYDLVVRNYDLTKIAKDVIVDINTTSVDDYLLISYSDTADWDCMKNAKLLSCQLKHDLLADTNETLRLEVKSPNSVTRVELNAALYSLYVNDTNLVNNHAYEDTNIIVTDLTSNNPREFTKVPLQGMVDMNIFGDLITIGNQSICEKDGSGNCQEPSYEVNDFVTQEYVNLDSVYGGSYKTSTSAKLEIDATDEVVWAGLYWMGRIDKTIAGYQTKIDNAQKVFIRADLNTSGYVEVQSQRGTDAVDNNGTMITVDKFNFINSSDYFDYQGVADVTAYVKANRGGDYWIADIQSSEGDNLSAGWNMIVIVRDTKLVPTRELKNITVFDGFQGVWKSPDYMTDSYPDEVNQTVSGFLTPATGAIKSNLIFFGFEGDRTLSDFVKVSDSTGTMHTLSNAKNPADDAVNGTITRDGVTVTSRAPSLDNSLGIDVDEFYLGDINETMNTGIINNGQTEAKISIGSLGMASNSGGGDRFFLGMFGFSTNLNDPVCYMQTLKNDSFTADLGADVQLGDLIGIELEFKNKEIQTLDNMHSFAQLDSMFREDQNTFELMNVAEGSFTSQSSLFEFDSVVDGEDNLTMVQTSIGLGAGAENPGELLNGGTLKTGESVYIRFNTVIDDSSDDNLTHNVYYVSYEPNPQKRVMVSRCSGDDQILQVHQNSTNGFEVTHHGGLSDDNVNDGFKNGDPADPSNENHLFTQVENQTFTVDVVALDDADEQQVRNQNYTGLIQVEIVDHNSTLAQMAETNSSYNACEAYSAISAPYYVAINNHNRESLTLLTPEVDKDVAIRVRYLVDEYNGHARWATAANNMGDIQNMLQNSYYEDDRCKDVCIDSPDEPACRACIFQFKVHGGLAKASCSTDIFAIKPETVDLELNTTTPIGGKNYSLDLNASAQGYDQTLNMSQISKSQGIGELRLTPASPPASCPDKDEEYYSGSIHFEQGNAAIPVISYGNIGTIDLQFLDADWTQYDQNSTAEFSDCVIGSSTNLPDADGKVGCEIGGTKEYTFVPNKFINNVILYSNAIGGNYLSNDANMSARLGLEVKALLADDTVASNYHEGCYAHGISFDYNLTASFTAIADPSRIRYYADSIGGTSVAVNADEGMFGASSVLFDNGTSDEISVFVNFKRRVNSPDNPFILRKNDFDLSVQDTNATSGSDFNRSSDQNASFYYARLNVPDIETDQNDINITMFYEVYCDDPSLKPFFPFTQGAESGNSVHWYINNSNHNAITQGDHSDPVSENGIDLAYIDFQGLRASLGGQSAPHSDRITYRPSHWLIYNEFNAGADRDAFNIRFVSTATTWAGKGDVGLTVDSNLSTKSIKKMEW